MINLRHSKTSKLLKKLHKVLSFYDIRKLIYLCYIKYNLATNFINMTEKSILSKHPHPRMLKLKIRIRIRGCAKSDIRPIPNFYLFKVCLSKNNSYSSEEKEILKHFFFRLPSPKNRLYSFLLPALYLCNNRYYCSDGTVWITLTYFVNLGNETKAPGN